MLVVDGEFPVVKVSKFIIFIARKLKLACEPNLGVQIRMCDSG